MRKAFPLLLIITAMAVSCPGMVDEHPSFPDFPGFGIGVNIGNTFDSLGTNDVRGETGWGNPYVSREYIQALKRHGFKTIRLPVSWADYIGAAPNYTVDDVWMKRVAEVVNWILAENMYCILNVHHDGADIRNKSWIEECRFEDKEDEVMDKFGKLWKQIAETFKGASDKLILEGMNEPQFDKLWPRNSSDQAKKTRAFYLLNTLNQTFVDAVRATGGNNATRFLLVPGYWTDIDMTINNWDTFFKMPTDTTEDKIILSLHYYTPWNFCGGDSSTWSNTNELNRQFNKVRDNILSKNIPVIIGEYGVNINNNNGSVNGSPKEPASRVEWLLGVTQKCIDLGICPVLWDTGMRPNNKGMADIQREAPFAITEDLKVMLGRLRMPE